MSPDNIVNHLTATRSLCIVYACDATPFRGQSLALFVKSFRVDMWVSARSALGGSAVRKFHIF